VSRQLWLCFPSLVTNLKIQVISDNVDYFTFPYAHWQL